MTFSERIPFESLMEFVARRLLGEPPRRNCQNTRRHSLRYERQLSVNYETGQFFDHEANLGGGVIDFLQHKGGHDRDGAHGLAAPRGLAEGSTHRATKGRRSNVPTITSTKAASCFSRSCAT